jgi:hypothetical protein
VDHGITEATPGAQSNINYAMTCQQLQQQQHQLLAFQLYATRNHRMQ